MKSSLGSKAYLIGVSVVAALGLALWSLTADSRAQRQARTGAPSSVKNENPELSSLDALQASIDAMKLQLQSIESQLQAMRARAAGAAGSGWMPATGEFLGIHRAQGVMPHESSAALGLFTSNGPRQETLRPIDVEIKHVAVDLAGGKLYGVGNHRILEIDSNTLELKELPIPAPLPELSWPCGMTYDSVRRRIVVASLGGDGQLYAFDPRARQWSLISSMQNLDLAALAYDAARDELVGLEVSHEGDARLHLFTPAGAHLTSRSISPAVRRGELGQFDCQLAIVGDQAVIVASAHYDSVAGQFNAHDSQIFVVDLWEADDANRASPRPPAAETATNTVAPPEQASGKFRSVDLQPFANQSLDAPFHLAHMTDNNLGQLPRGQQVLDGVTFQIGDKCIQLAGTLLSDRPTSSGEMPCEGKVARLHFLHASGWGEGSGGTADLGYIADDTQIAKYVIHYADGAQVDVPVVYGRDLRGWWQFHETLPDTTATVAWRGSNGTTDSWGVSLRLYHMTWQNPRPEAEVASVEFESVNHTIAAPFCVAISAESLAEK